MITAHPKVHAFLAEIRRAINPPPCEYYFAWKNATTREERAAAYAPLTPADRRRDEKDSARMVSEIVERHHQSTREFGKRLDAERAQRNALLKEKERGELAAEQERISRLPTAGRMVARSKRAFFQMVTALVVGFFICLYALWVIANLWDVARNWKPLLIMIGACAALYLGIFGIYFLFRFLRIFFVVTLALPRAFLAAARTKI